MSRQSDIKALREMRDTIIETKHMIKMSESELEKYEACEKELTTSKFVFQPLPTNHEEQARTKFRNEWIEKFSDSTSMRKLVMWIYTAIMIVFGVLVLLDMCLAKGWFFNNIEGVKAFFKQITTGIFWLPFLAQVIFTIAAIIFPWIILMFDIDEKFHAFGVTLIVCVVSGFFFWAYCDSIGEFKTLWIYIILTALGFVSQGVVNVVYKILKKIPCLSAKQKAIVQEEKRKDTENAEKNIEKEEKDRAEWQAWWDVHKFELDKQMDIHMDMAKSAIAKAEELQAKVEESDVLGPNEKDVAIIDWLLYFIEGHRADSIKEALQQFDLMQHNEKMLEIEREKYNLEAARIQQEREDRERELEMQRYHQMRMEAEARRTADMQTQIAYNTAAAAREAEKLRREASSVASATADYQNRMQNEATWQRLNDYYNN